MFWEICHLFFLNLGASISIFFRLSNTFRFFWFYFFTAQFLFVFSLSEELVALTTRFTDELINQGLTKHILTLVSEISVTREFERLQKERGLGNEKHRKEV